MACVSIRKMRCATPVPVEISRENLTDFASKAKSTFYFGTPRNGMEAVSGWKLFKNQYRGHFSARRLSTPV